VQRLEACLVALPARERRVVALRAGLGQRRPITRAGVARLLHIPAGSVRWIERRGIRELRDAERRGNCSSAGVAGAAPVTPGTAGLPAAATVPGGAPESTAEGGAQLDWLGSASGDARGGVKGATAVSPPPLFTIGRDSGIDLLVIVGAIGLVGLLVALELLRMMNRHRKDAYESYRY
jgi:hypothetical protein